MSTTREPAYSEYDQLCKTIEYAGYIGKEFSAPFCLKLLEQIETQAQKAQALQQRNEAIEPLLVEVVAHLRLQSHFSKEARLSLLERAEKALNNSET